MSRHCRFCHTPLTHTFADLGLSPLSNSYVKAERLNQGEVFYPLHAWVCPNCQLVQLEEFEQAENIFNDEYAYFSSYSSSWLAHAKHYSEAMTARFGLNARSQVVEIASNDGYLLQNFVAAGIPALGVEPTGRFLHEIRRVNTEVDFFRLCYEFLDHNEPMALEPFDVGLEPHDFMCGVNG